MGSTGSGILKSSNRSALAGETFGIRGAKDYSGKIPASSGLEKTGPNKITLRVPSSDRQDIIFQFKLIDGNKNLSIRAYDPNQPSKGKVSVTVSAPSLDTVIKTGDKTEKANALKIRDMMTKSSAISEAQLGQIAQRLKMNKKKR